MNDKMKAKCYRLDYNELGLSTLCVEKDKEIERLKDDNKYLNKVNIELSSEKNRLHSIMKEVRDYIELVETLATVDKVNIMSMSSLKSILDKEKE